MTAPATIVATMWDGGTRVLGTPRAVLTRMRSEAGWSTILSDAQGLALDTPGAPVEITAAQLDALARSLIPENQGIKPTVRTIEVVPFGSRHRKAGSTWV